MSYSLIAEELVNSLGGEQNIVSVAHCATRLRVMVADEAKIDKERIEDTDKVKGAFFNSVSTKLSSELGRLTVCLKRFRISIYRRLQSQKLNKQQTNKVRRYNERFAHSVMYSSTDTCLGSNRIVYGASWTCDAT